MTMSSTCFGRRIGFVVALLLVHCRVNDGLMPVLQSRRIGKPSLRFLFMVTPPSLDYSNLPPPKKVNKKPVALKHLFRHYDDISMDCWLRCEEPITFLRSCGYTPREVEQVVLEYPAILEKNVHDHLAPHIRFLVKAMGGGTGDLMWASSEEQETAFKGHATKNQEEEEEEEECTVSEDSNQQQHQLRVSELAKQVVPVKTFFNLRLEKTLAPWHAYMTWQAGLPSGRILLEQEQQGASKLTEFLRVCQTGKLTEFVKMCNAWEKGTDKKVHTPAEISAFTSAFQEGLVPAVRNHLHYVDAINDGMDCCEPGQMVELLLSHGANHLEDDHHGASLLHWAAGTGNLRAVQALLKVGQEDGIPVHDIIDSDQVAKDGATVLHWAACGVTSQGVFGSGGHLEICRLVLDMAGKNLANQTTYSHNSPLEWAAWAGSLDVVKLLIEEHGADPHYCSDSGNVAHWACAGGSLDVCQYLADTCKVDFCIPNKAMGWTPLNLASSEYHPDVAEWLVQRFYQTTSEDRGYQQDKQEIQNEVAVALQNEHIQNKLKASPN
jgi:ankyrin repeat protein